MGLASVGPGKAWGPLGGLFLGDPSPGGGVSQPQGLQFGWGRWEGVRAGAAAGRPTPRACLCWRGPPGSSKPPQSRLGLGAGVGGPAQLSIPRCPLGCALRAGPLLRLRAATPLGAARPPQASKAAGASSVSAFGEVLL